MNYGERRAALIEYLKSKTQEADWHAVSDAANDLRVMEAKGPAETEPLSAAEASKGLPIGRQCICRQFSDSDPDCPVCHPK